MHREEYKIVPNLPRPRRGPGVALAGPLFFFQAGQPHLVEVVPAELAVAGGRDNLGDAAADLQHRNVEGSAAEVENQDQLVAALAGRICCTICGQCLLTLRWAFWLGWCR